MKKYFILLSAAIIFFIFPSLVFAKNDPTSVPNNKFGIHITDENDLKDAQTLVNSSGGDWGYVTFVITEKERNRDRWQQVFDNMRRLHLIPIVRIATKLDGNSWTIPSKDEIDGWVAFLNSLNWVIQNRYVVIGNEPNHSLEWGGKIDPEGYAQYLNEISQKLKNANSDFFIISAGLDASAKNTPTTMDEALFLKRMVKANPQIFESIDGWSSHSYPNPAFSGKETDTGRGTIDSFNWELSYLEKLGIVKKLPVFITETGWSNKNLDTGKIADMYKYAFEKVWSDPKIVAVTPFILNYPQEPFSEFSWKGNNGVFLPYYSAVSGLPKAEGKPVQIISGEIFGGFTQPISLAGGNFIGIILAKNTGQSIWDPKSVFLKSQGMSIKDYSIPVVEPMRLGLIVFKAIAPEQTGIYKKQLFLQTEGGKKITGEFNAETLVVKLGEMNIGSFFAKMGSYLHLAH